MSVRSEDGTIYLEARCRIEDAEALLSALQQAPGSTVSLSRADALHTAIIQVLLACKPPIVGAEKHDFLARYRILDLSHGPDSFI